MPVKTTAISGADWDDVRPGGTLRRCELLLFLHAAFPLPGMVIENDGDVLQRITLLHTCSSARVGGQGQPLSHSVLAELCVTLSP